MRRKWLWIAFLLAAAVEFFLLIWVRGEFRTVEAEGKEYVVPVSVQFADNFYEKNYITLHVPIDKAQWSGPAAPVAGESVYVSIRAGENEAMEVLGAQPDQPSGEYLLVRAKHLEGDVLYFDFPSDRLYMDEADRRKIPVTEVAERIQVRDPDTGRTETRMKNTLTARVRVKDGRAVITALLVNGSPVTAAFTTVGTNADVKYAASGKEKDTVVPMGDGT